MARGRSRRLLKTRTIDMTLTGGEDLLDMMVAGGKNITMFAGQMLYRYANDVVFYRSQQLVPVDTGALRSSGHVTKPVVSGGRVMVKVGYGGSAAPYALYVHEDPDARHALPTQFKFLEKPMVETYAAFSNEFARELKQFFVRRSGPTVPYTETPEAPQSPQSPSAG